MNNTFSKISASILLDKIEILFTFQNIGLHTSGQDIDPFYLSKYRPPYFWTRYDYSSEVHDKGDPLSKLLE